MTVRVAVKWLVTAGSRLASVSRALTDTPGVVLRERSATDISWQLGFYENNNYPVLTSTIRATMANVTDLQTKYSKLAQEYSKVRHPQCVFNVRMKWSNVYLEHTRIPCVSSVICQIAMCQYLWVGRRFFTLLYMYDIVIYRFSD